MKPLRAFIVVLLLLTGCGVSKTALQSLKTGLGQALPGYHVDQIVDVGESLSESSRPVSAEEEHLLGRAVAARILSRFPPRYSRPLDLYVNRVGLVLAANSERPETYGGYRFLVLDTADPISFAAPGGYIFISRGALQALPSEDALAAILAHEVAHVALRHGLDALSHDSVMKSLMKAGREVCVSECGGVVSQLASQLGQQADAVFSTVVEKGYGRSQEYEADAMAVQILKRSGYNPHALVDALLALEKRAALDGSGMFTSHPGPERRRDRVARAVDSAAGAVKGESVRTSRYLQQMRAARLS